MKDYDKKLYISLSLLEINRKIEGKILKKRRELIELQAQNSGCIKTYIKNGIEVIQRI